MSVHKRFPYPYRYDDTYDDVIDVVEPDNILRLNVRKSDMANRDDNYEEEEEDSESKPKFDAFCEDPAIVRARLEQRRMDKQRRGGGGGHSQGPPPQPRDVVGRARGQGQDKDVVYNRRQKTANKGAGGNFKKRADFKRKEF